MTNKSLRCRFGEGGPSSSTVSKLLATAVGDGLIKPVDPETAPRYMRYVPAWA
jgi:ATP-dependent DNA helicase RecG